MQNVFDREAKYYNLFHQDKDYKDEALKISLLYPKVKTILEIGSGTGNLTKELVKLGYKVTCIEPSFMMNSYNPHAGFWGTIQEYEHKGKPFDLVIAMYDVLDYIPEKDLTAVMYKIGDIGKEFIYEVWDRKKFVKPLTIKRVGLNFRIRLGFKFRDKVYLWYFFLGKYGFLANFHKLYL
jgi:SAM-dependent methyltransferase